MAVKKIGRTGTRAKATAPATRRAPSKRPAAKTAAAKPKRRAGALDGFRSRLIAAALREWANVYEQCVTRNGGPSTGAFVFINATRARADEIEKRA